MYLNILVICYNCADWVLFTVQMKQRSQLETKKRMVPKKLQSFKSKGKKVRYISLSLIDLLSLCKFYVLCDLI